ncbi:ABC transporter substrate-binding protein [Aquibium sp. ELW1220]|uniref:ABC transporter substrate-binding protein n=1 Tax=Aquibium sp. ELW1220 TaxID=2976766 RepID=UPI0025B27DA0|nr:ABC transporter substrate-binding protein [Aquibium sp. ELW1220]MDN2582917.1 ABC transporter substrate-binding protein [Aquibium sp. ELW1220]
MPFEPTRRGVLQGLSSTLMMATAAMPIASRPARAAGKTLRIAISLSDIPNLWAVPTGGFEGARFGGYTLFDPLVSWDMSSADKPSGLVPGLAESWSVDPDNQKRWIFKLREATFHDGSPWNADAAIWNFEGYLNRDAPHFHPGRAGMAGARTQSIAGYGKIDDMTIYLETKYLNSLLPFELSTLFFASPARHAEVGNWENFAVNPSGTGPYAFVSLTPGSELRLKAYESYWNPQRVPRTPELVLMPVPDANTRVAALRSGQVDLVDTLPPDSIPSLEAAGFTIIENTYPHSWIWRLNFTEDSPFSDIRVRKAANLAIDRDAIVEFLGGHATAAKAFAQPGSPWYGKPAFEFRYDPEAAKALLAEAGYGPDKPVELTIVISSSGGGQMVPLSMNEVIQSYMREVGINVTFDVRDFGTMITMLRQGAKESGADALNVAMTMQEPATGVVSFTSVLAPPAGGNWGFYNNPAFDEALAAARATFDPAALDAAMSKVMEVVTDDAAALVVVHDTNPRALSPKLKGFVQAKNWYQDFTPIEVTD